MRRSITKSSGTSMQLEALESRQVLSAAFHAVPAPVTTFHILTPAEIAAHAGPQRPAVNVLTFHTVPPGSQGGQHPAPAPVVSFHVV